MHIPLSGFLFVTLHGLEEDDLELPPFFNVSASDEEFLPERLIEPDVLPDDIDLGFLGGSLACLSLVFFSGLLDTFLVLLLWVAGDLSGVAGRTSFEIFLTNEGFL